MIQAHLSNQQAQIHGYWLSDWQLSTEIALPINFHLNLNGKPLTLFSQKQPQHIQCLSPSKIDTKKWHFDTKTFKKTKNSQAWVFLEAFQQSLNINQPVCLMADEHSWTQVFYLAQSLKLNAPLLAILAGETQPFPFQVKPARYLFAQLPPQAANMIGACPLLEDWGIANRLCHSQAMPGCFEGTLAQFQTFWQPPKDWQCILLSNQEMPHE